MFGGGLDRRRLHQVRRRQVLAIVNPVYFQHGDVVKDLAGSSAQNVALRVGGVHFDAIDDVDQFAFTGQHLGVDDDRQRRRPAVKACEHFAPTIRAWFRRRFDRSAVGGWLGHGTTQYGKGVRFRGSRFSWQFFQ